MDPASEKLPPARDEKKAYLVDGATWEKIRHLVSRPQIGMDAQQFDYVEDAAGVRTYRYKGGSGANLYYVINRLNVDEDGRVIMAEAEQWTRYFENGLLQWEWSSEWATEPEPEVPAGTPTFYSVELTAL